MTKIDAKAHPKAAAAEAKMIARLKGASTAMLLELAEMFHADPADDEKGIVLDYALIELESRMSEADYVEFLGRLEAAV